MKKKEKPNLTVVVQHNSLVNSRYDMNLLEMKIFLMMLAHVDKEDQEFKECHIPVNFIYDEPKGSSYQHIRNSCDALTKKNIMIEDRNRKRFEAYPLMGYCRYDDGEASLRAKFNEHIKPYLLQLKGNFTMSSLKHLWRLNSVYSIRIYNLLRERKDFMGRTDSLQEFKNMLGLAEKYTEVWDLKRRVLDVAQKELESTDLSFNYKMLKTGRRITHIKFSITGKPEPIQLEMFAQAEQAIEKNDDPYHDRALNVLKGWKLSDHQIKQIMRADTQKICQVSYQMKLQLSDHPIHNTTGWAYAEFIKRLGL